MTRPYGPTIITTGRLRLRPPDPSDLALLEHHAGDIRVACATRTLPHPLPPGAMADLLVRAQAADRAEDLWVIDSTPIDGSAVSGLITLERMGRGQSEIAYWVAPDVWGGGIASEAVQALVAANPQGSETIFAQVFQDNPASARVLANAGFVWLGDAESHCAARNAIVPTWTYLRRCD